MKVTFENATIVDAVNKATRVVPTKGQAFEKASGLIMELDSKEQTATLRATDLMIFYLEVVDAVEVEGDGIWRFPVTFFPPVIAKLPIGSGKTVTLEQKGNEVFLKSKTTSGRFRMSDPTYYPDWKPFDPALLEIVPDLGARLRQVEWAASDDHTVNWGGIHLNGTHVLATDRFRVARVECEAEPIFKPVTIPGGILKPVISQMRDVAVGIEGGQFLMMPDQSTQIRCVTFDKDYPNLDPVFAQDWPDSCKVNKADFLEIIGRVEVFGSQERDSRLHVMVGKSQIAVMMSDQEMGLLGDLVDVSGAGHDKRHTIYFSPRNLKQALEAAPSNEVEFFYDQTNANKPIKIDGGSGYVALVMPRKEAQGGGH